MAEGETNMTTSLSLLIYLTFMLIIFVVAAHFTKDAFHNPEESDEQASNGSTDENFIPETPFVETVETVEFRERVERVDEAEAHIRLPNGREHKLTHCYRGATDDMDVEVYVAEGITLIVKNRKLVNY